MATTKPTNTKKKPKTILTEKMTMKGFGWDPKTKSIAATPKDIKREMPFSNWEGNNHSGMPITVDAFLEMIKKFSEGFDNGSKFGDVKSVAFSKASLFRILSQPGCEFIRFHFCIPEGNDRVSLALEGLGIDHMPLKHEVVLKRAQKMASKSSKMLGDAPPANDLEDGDPNYEERGNGTTDPTTPAPPAGGVTSLRAIHETYKKNLVKNRKVSKIKPDFSHFIQHMHEALKK